MSETTNVIPFNALERLLRSSNHCALLTDEIGQLSDADLGEIVYRIACSSDEIPMAVHLKRLADGQEAGHE